jgi:Co/Zn/Cd efflux system component
LSEKCCPVKEVAADSSRYRRVLWIALAVNVVMFLVEIGASFRAESAALLADAIDFAGDTANYGLSLGAIALGPLWQSRAALVKAVSMTAYGIFVLAMSGWALLSGSQPEPVTMGAVGAVALVANLSVAALLFTFRDGNANMRSVWLCTRNDAIGNVAVLAAALGVFGTGSHLPDLLVAGVLASLAITAGLSTLRQARQELRAA